MLLSPSKNAYGLSGPDGFDLDTDEASSLDSPSPWNAEFHMANFRAPGGFALEGGKRRHGMCDCCRMPTAAEQLSMRSTGRDPEETEEEDISLGAPPPMELAQRLNNDSFSSSSAALAPPATVPAEYQRTPDGTDEDDVFEDTFNSPSRFRAENESLKLKAPTTPSSVPEPLPVASAAMALEYQRQGEWAGD